MPYYPEKEVKNEMVQLIKFIKNIDNKGIHNDKENVENKKKNPTISEGEEC